LEAAIKEKLEMHFKPINFDNLDDWEGIQEDLAGHMSDGNVKDMLARMQVFILEVKNVKDRYASQKDFIRRIKAEYKQFKQCEQHLL